VDAFSTVQKQIRMLNLILYFHQRAQRVIKRGAPISVIHALPIIDRLIRMKMTVANEEVDKLEGIRQEINDQFDKLEAEYL
jgi:V/A-type H+-transporting ATPase subunit A